MNFRVLIFFMRRYLRHTRAPLYGVAVGVFSFVVVLSIMAGFVNNIKSEIIKLTPHISIVSNIPNQNIDANENLLQNIQNIAPSEILAVVPFQNGHAILQSENLATLITLEGIDPQNSPSVLDIEKFLVLGFGFSKLAENATAIIGRDLALQLNVNLDDTITLVSVLFDEGIAPVQMPVVISGIYDTGRSYLDSKIVYASLQTANRFFSSPNMWKGLQLKLKDPFHPEPVVQKLNHALKDKGLVAQPWTVKNTALLKALFLEHLGMILVMSMIILVGCFSITISLLFSLHRKTRELAILRGLGLRQKDLSLLYLGQGFCIGLIGVVIGLVLGFATLYIVHTYRIPFITSSYSNEPLPIIISVWDVFLVSIGSVCLATLAAFWPAYEVRRLNVVDVLAIRK